MNSADINNDELNSEISQYLSDSGYAMITTTELKGHTALKLCPIHPETTHEHLDKTIKLMDDYIEKKVREAKPE